MELSSVHGHASLAAKLVVLFCIVWPIVTLTFTRMRGRSPVPVLAALIPVAIGACGMWIDIVSVLHIAALSGGGRASAAAGMVEAWFVLAFGIFCAFAVAFFALLKRHRPSADRGTMVLAALVIANAVAGLTLSTSIAAAYVAAVIAGAMGIGAFVWLVRVVRERVVPRAIPYGGAVVFVALVALLVLLRERVNALLHVAMGG